MGTIKDLVFQLAFYRLVHPGQTLAPGQFWHPFFDVPGKWGLLEKCILTETAPWLVGLPLL